MIILPLLLLIPAIAAFVETLPENWWEPITNSMVGFAPAVGPSDIGMMKRVLECGGQDLGSGLPRRLS